MKGRLNYTAQLPKKQGGGNNSNHKEAGFVQLATETDFFLASKEFRSKPTIETRRIHLTSTEDGACSGYKGDEQP